MPHTEKHRAKHHLLPTNFAHFADQFRRNCIANWAKLRSSKNLIAKASDAKADTARQQSLVKQSKKMPNDLAVRNNRCIFASAKNLYAAMVEW